MKRYVVYLLVLMCAACSRVGEQKPTAAAVDGGGAPGDIPTDAEIAGFISTWQDPEDANKSVVFAATFDIAHLRPHVMEEFRERGKIPFVISVDFVRHEGELANDYSIMDGQIEIAVLDADGKIVDRQTKPLDLLCPS